MSASSEPEQVLMSLDEYITLCADLHNTLLVRSFSPNSPPADTSSDLLQRYESYRANPPLDPDYDAPSLDLLSPLATLLSRLKTTVPLRSGTFTPPTPLLYQPLPEWLFPPLYSHDFDAASSAFLLLYPQRLPSDALPAMDGGLFVDIYTLYGIWLDALRYPAISPSEKQLPLDCLLKQELSRWESGRYVHDPSAEEGLRIQKWVPIPSTIEEAVAHHLNLQVAEAISEWERLLYAIESKMPSLSTPKGEASKRESGQPLRLEGMQRLRLSRFAQHFLSRARRPKGWTFIAPGIGTFSNERLREVYITEAEDTFRRTFTTSEEGEDWIILLPSLAGDNPVMVPADVSHVPDLEINSFDKPFAFGKATVGRRAGLYTSWADERDGDLVQLWPMSLGTQQIAAAG
ncbi:uncharacterized protein B0T15DRAFT_557217 [Chaetomium strumarium]|uniref:Uncharacterized protein n=1 Tax=Chaetomium strumarium TaxID=1170767 RepID=A0AAJ0M245_9PEZI|nr:hypothetical protein B0T15DRAFT_557217 [Chaetomium strumarium]